MNDNDSKQGGSPGDNDVRQLLNLAGPREEPPSDMRARVYAAAHEAWQEAPCAEPETSASEPITESKFRFTAFRAAAAGFAMLGIALFSSWLNVSGAPDKPLGELVFASGEYTFLGKPGQEGSQLNSGSMLETHENGHVMITIDDTTHIRLDTKTRVTLQSSNELWLHNGRIYIDAPGTESQINVITPVGVVSDIGTQFTVALNDQTLAVAVREGEVHIALGSTTIAMKAEAGQGEKLYIDSQKNIERVVLSSTDEEWSWIYQAAVEFKLDQHSLYEFLIWASRESGLTLDFKSEAVRLSAQQISLHGDIQGMNPVEALKAVLATTNFQTLSGSQAHHIVIDYRR